MKNDLNATFEKEYDCWLKYNKIECKELVESYKKWCGNIVVLEERDLMVTALNELLTGIKEMLGITPLFSENMSSFNILIGILKEDNVINKYIEKSEVEIVCQEGYIIKDIFCNNSNSILIAGRSQRGIIYGVFAFLRLLQMNKKLENVYIIDNPKNKLRILDHWDNMDGSIERGYAGASFFFKNGKITEDYKRIRDYARLLASIGINGIVINNVNVHKVESRLITKKYLPCVAKLAQIFMGYGITTYLSINYASPIELGGLETADPLNEDVKKWWKDAAQEIYDHIPCFGGFLVKADSEFRPGPFTYKRTHADGANMLGDALKPFGGIVIWRCFVYNCLQDWRDRKTDRARAAYDNFMPLDGLFNDNVLLQIKNGPMDFQVREPVSPLIGGLLNTNHLIELQITQEYTGQQKHLCYLVPMWKEIMEFDTYCKGKGSYVKDVVSGSIYNNTYGGVAAVANVGDSINWTGFSLAQSNLYGFGRLAWNPDLACEEITEEWVRMTFSNCDGVVDVVSDMLMKSWRIYENYTTPLGIGWMVNPNHHYGPNVDGYEYSKWGTYHRADINGIGVDRTVKAGTGYAGQYFKEVADIYEDMETCPEELLLFFHHVSYNYRLKSGETLIQYIYNSHFDGVNEAIKLKEQWISIKDKVDYQLHIHVLKRLEVQIEDAREWCDVVNSYFYRKTGIEDKSGRKIY